MAGSRLSRLGGRVRAFGRDHAVTLIALYAFGVIMAAFLSLVIYGGLANNRLTVERETALLQRAVDRRLATILEDVTSATIWTDAYEKSLARTDYEWLDINFGQYYARYLKHDLTIAFDEQDRPFYASSAGKMVPPAQLSGFSQAVAPILRQVRTREAAHMAVAPQSLGFARHISAGSAVRVGQEVYLVQASTVVPEEQYRGPLVHPHPVVVSAVRVGPHYLQALDADYGLREVRLVDRPPARGKSVALRGYDGQPVGALVWTPELPGVRVYQDVKWIILAIAAGIAVALGLLVNGMDRMTRELRVAREKAEAANTAKSEFLANVSHEIRTPLNGVLGMAHVMARDDLSPAQRERLSVIRESGAALLSLLNDVLDLAKIQAGKLELQQATFSVLDLCRTVCATFEGLAAAKGVELNFHVQTEGRLMWRGDPVRLRQVLANLVSNGVKFTEAGEVRLTARLAEGGLAFEVVDTGIGLTEGEISRLFQKFSQADASTTRRFGGSGLGLAICHDLVGLMQGRLTVQSAPGEGTRFVLTVPLEEAVGLAMSKAAGGQAEPVLDIARPLRVLAAEDDPTNQWVLRALLQSMELELQVVANGAEAVAAFKERRFDLVLMDVQMPQMSGVEATRAIREIELAEGRRRTPIVALSANTMVHQVDEYRLAGMDGHLGKPLEIEKLYAVLQQAARRDPNPFRPANEEPTFSTRH